jgi:hypothetical protein
VFSFCFCLLIILLWVFYFYSYFVFSFCIINFTITIFSSLFSPPSYSLLLCYNPLFSFPTTLSAPSHPLSPPAFTSPSHPPTNCHHTTPPSYILTYCTNFIQPQPLQSLTQAPYSSRNTPKHTQEPQNPAAPKSLPPLTHLTSCLPF